MLAFWVLFQVSEEEAEMNDNEMQSTKKADTRTVSIPAEMWHALLEIAGRQIDPETAEVCWAYELTLDPYRVYPDLPEELQQVERTYFARVLEARCGPNSEIYLTQLGRRSGCGLSVHLQSSMTNCLFKNRPRAVLRGL
jgi:hypothetical protein